MELGHNTQHAPMCSIVILLCALCDSSYQSIYHCTCIQPGHGKVQEQCCTSKLVTKESRESRLPNQLSGSSVVAEGDVQEKQDIAN